MDKRILCIIIQVVVAKNIESNLKKPRHHYTQEHPNLMPADYSILFENEPKAPQKRADKILTDLHEENNDSYYDETKNEQPTSVEFSKWFEDVTSSKISSTAATTKEHTLNCTGENELSNVVHYLTVLNDNIEELKNIITSNKAYLVMRIPNRPKYRNKRDVNATEVMIDVKTDNKTAAGRRYMNVDTTNDIKSKLLFYLEDAFNEINKKIKSLSILKNTYSEDNNFKIGYVVANIDTLDVNLKKLRDEMETNKHLWDDRKVLDLFDNLKVSDNVLSSLLESLKNYVNIKSLY